MAIVERLTPAQRRGRSHYYFDGFCFDYSVENIFNANMTFVSTGDFLTEVVQQIVAAHTALDMEKNVWKGRTSGNYIRFSQIPAVYRAAVTSLIEIDNAAPGHCRGRHTTSPVLTGGVGNTWEYDLSANRQGRLTVRNFGQRKAYYYSRHHAAATYEYLLITDYAGRPIFRGNLPATLMRVALV